MRRNKYSARKVETVKNPVQEEPQAVVLPCPVCDRTYKTEDGFYNHVETKHDDYEGDLDDYLESLGFEFAEGGETE